VNESDERIASVVVLVHGTFARGTKWPLIEAEARRELAEPVRVEYFEWTGKNRVDDRRRATRDLQTQLDEWYRRFPKAAFYVVAHSHGGNVALRALSADHDSGRVRALICLSTPFLDAAVRLPGESTGLLLLLSFVGWGAALLLGSHWVSGSWVFASILLLVVMAAYTRFAFGAGRRVPNLVAQIALPECVFPRVFVVRSPHDEAAIGLTLAQVVHVVLSLWRRFDALFDVPRTSETVSGTDRSSIAPADNLPPAAVVALIVSAGTWIAVSWWYRDLVPSEWMEGWRFAVLLFVYLCLLVSVVFTTAFLLALMFFAAFGLPALLVNAYLLFRVFGSRDAIAATLFVEVAVEPVLAGTFPCCQLPWRPNDPRRGMYHSLTYQDSIAVRQVGRWLKEAQEVKAVDLDSIGPF
jgi:hypothetical protein